jgi:hypothetical protein
MATETPTATSDVRGLARLVLFQFAVVVVLIFCSLFVVSAIRTRVLVRRVCRFGDRSATVRVVHDWHNAVVAETWRPNGAFSGILLLQEKGPADKAKIEFDEDTGEIVISCGPASVVEYLGSRPSKPKHPEPQGPGVQIIEGR